MKKLILLFTLVFSFNTQAMNNIQSYFSNNKLTSITMLVASYIIFKNIFPSSQQTYNSNSHNKIIHNSSVISTNGSVVYGDTHGSNVIATNGSTIYSNPIFDFIHWMINLIINSSSTNITVHDAGETASKEINIFKINNIIGWGIGHVHITCDPNGKEKLIITADKNILAILEGYQSDTTLNFGPKSNSCFTTWSPITYAILVKKLSNLSLSGSLNATTNAINSGELQIKTSGSVILNSEINTNNFIISCSGCSKATLTGIAKNQTLHLSGASKLKTQECTGDIAIIKTSGASSAYLSVKNQIKYNISGASTIIYRYTPQITGSTSGYARICRQ